MANLRYAADVESIFSGSKWVKPPRKPSCLVLQDAASHLFLSRTALTPTPAASSSGLRTPSLGNFCRGKYSWLYNQIVEAINLEEYLVFVLAKIWGVKMRHPMTVAISVSTCWIPTWCVVLNYLGLSETWVPHSIHWSMIPFPFEMAFGGVYSIFGHTHSDIT